MYVNAIAARHLMSKVDFTFGSPDIGILCSFGVGPWGGANVRSDSTINRVISFELTITIPEVASPNS
jgi:hypothetical protein